MAKWWLGAVLVLGIGAFACGGEGGTTPDVEDDTGDAGDVGDNGDVGDTGDAGDVEDTTDGDEVEETTDGTDGGADAKHTVILPTSGGGQISSTNFRMRVYVGTPQPMGSAAGTAYRAGFGPGAQGNQ